MAHADASLGVIQNVQHHQIGQYINRSTLFHIRDLCGVISHLEEDYKDCSSTDIVVVNFPHHEQGDADRFVTERRRTQNVGDNQ